MEVTTKHQTYGTHPRSPEESRRIREWAKRNGVEVNSRGRLPFHVIELYENREGE